MCKVRDHDLIELVAGVWAKAQDGPMISDDLLWQIGYGGLGEEYLRCQGADQGRYCSLVGSRQGWSKATDWTWELSSRVLFSES